MGTGGPVIIFQEDLFQAIQDRSILFQGIVQRTLTIRDEGVKRKTGCGLQGLKINNVHRGPVLGYLALGQGLCPPTPLDERLLGQSLGLDDKLEVIVITVLFKGLGDLGIGFKNHKILGIGEKGADDKAVSSDVTSELQNHITGFDETHTHFLVDHVLSEKSILQLQTSLDGTQFHDCRIVFIGFLLATNGIPTLILTTFRTLTLLILASFPILSFPILSFPILSFPSFLLLALLSFRIATELSKDFLCSTKSSHLYFCVSVSIY